MILVHGTLKASEEIVSDPAFLREFSRNKQQPEFNENSWPADQSVPASRSHHPVVHIPHG